MQVSSLNIQKVEELAVVSIDEVKNLVDDLGKLAGMDPATFVKSWQKILSAHADSILFYEKNDAEGVAFRVEKEIKNKAIQIIQEKGWQVGSRGDLIYFSPPSLPNRREGFMKSIYNIVDAQAFERMPERVKNVINDKISHVTLSKLRWEINRYVENPALPDRERQELKRRWHRAEDLPSYGGKVKGMKNALVWLFSTEDEHRLIRWGKTIEGYAIVHLILNLPARGPARRPTREKEKIRT